MIDLGLLFWVIVFCIALLLIQERFDFLEIREKKGERNNEI